MYQMCSLYYRNSQVFSCEFCENSKNTLFIEHIYATASVVVTVMTEWRLVLVPLPLTVWKFSILCLISLIANLNTFLQGVTSTFYYFGFHITVLWLREIYFWWVEIHPRDGNTSSDVCLYFLTQKIYIHC